MFRKTALLIGIGLLIVLNFYVYWSVHLYYKGTQAVDEENKFSILNRSRRMNPFNDRVYYELGKVYFDRGVSQVADDEERNENLNKSVQNFIRSVQLNPGSYTTHFRLAQALSYMDYFQPVQIDYYEQYKKAALLTTYDEDIYFDIGRIMLSNWEELNEEDQTQAVAMMKNVIDTKKKQGLMDVIQVWATYVEDYSVINRILPQRPEALRMYAEFLGGRSLSLEERLEKLSRAESMEFKAAKELYNQGQREAGLYHMKNALSHLSSSLANLNKIRFYQSLVGEKLIDEEEFLNLKKSVLLGLIKLRLQRTGELKEVKEYLKTYLEMEEEEVEIEEIEEFLMERDLLEFKPGGKESFLRLYFKLIFDFKQHRYREVIKESSRVEELYFSDFPGTEEELVRILQIAGDSYQRTDFVYDANEFYQKALEVNPRDIETLIRMRENYKRLNDVDKMREVDEKISEISMPDEIMFEDREIKKGQLFKVPLMFTEESKVFIDIALKEESGGPLVAVFFNGRVIEERYGEKNQISGLELMTQRGKNILELKPVSKRMELVKIAKTE
ncbi:MAG: hypothetical protein ACQERH_09250 [Acidobacteriota bacterium]